MNVEHAQSLKGNLMSGHGDRELVERGSQRE